ncbi:leucyl/phenylalanyl-tRNA--protein transferase [Niveibacterium terrae]|uniref:leucyl/phenylalanyl-tRNA--protein transferase n=1 Tax=Niveibacterium terrae TaxID=3373598 RepID=UPI003A92052C
MPITLTWLEAGRPDFPDIERALDDPAGLLAAGGSLAPDWLIEAYRRGIFPWYSRGEPILWWSPDPRMVLFPDEIRISRSLAKRLKRGEAQVRCDSAFTELITACAAPRAGASGTWITAEMLEAYLRLFTLGWAHSVETWMDGELVGGLYGIAIGKVFYGESMFSRADDASKIALAHLAKDLARRGFAVIDCQMKTAHLASMGAREIGRAEFKTLLAAHASGEPERWASARMQDLAWGSAKR